MSSPPTLTDTGTSRYNPTLPLDERGGRWLLACAHRIAKHLHLTGWARDEAAAHAVYWAVRYAKVYDPAKCPSVRKYLWYKLYFAVKDFMRWSSRSRRGTVWNARMQTNSLDHPPLEGRETEAAAALSLAAHRREREREDASALFAQAFPNGVPEILADWMDEGNSLEDLARKYGIPVNSVHWRVQRQAKLAAQRAGRPIATRLNRATCKRNKETT